MRYKNKKQKNKKNKTKQNSQIFNLESVAVIYTRDCIKRDKKVLVK